ncbi:transforming growth factor, beta receptor associated protein 1 [Mortierella alpina]|nr:transforming growth factor, beta receptor associated protein 1 [Mortierella alpina]
MFTTFTVQPLLRGVHLDDASAAAESSFSPGSRSLLDRPASGALAGATSPGSKSTSIFNRNSKPVVEALDNFENHLYLGTSDGYILHYVIEEQISSESELPRSRLVQRKSLGFGKKVVERIMVISKLRIAIVHCDSTLSFYSLPDFAPFSHALPPIKGVTAFCDDGSQKGHVAEDGSVRLCVAKRRIILFYNLWHDAISEPKELTLPNGALIVSRWKNFVCFADANDFNLIDCRVGRMIPVLPVVQSASSGANAQVLRPTCIAIAENEFLLASATSSGQTAIGIFCTGAGDPVRGTLQWSSYPRALGVEFPYVAALLRNNVVEIHNILDQRLIQTIRFDPSAELRTLVQGPGLAVWMSMLANVLTMQSADLSPEMDAQQHAETERRQQEANRISTVLARVLVAGKESVSALVTTPLVLHADVLLQKGHVEEALLLSEKTMTTLSAENLHRERLQYELDYIYQKSGLIYLGETLFDDAFALLKRGNIWPQALISLFPDVLQHSELMRHVKLYRGIQEQLRQLRINRTLSKSGGEQDAEFGKVLLVNAKDVFIKYLQRCRKEYTNRKGHPGPEAVATDTALLGLWVDNNDDANLHQLLESNNACAADICERKLRDSNKHYALSLWHKAHRNYSATLSIWKRLLLGEITDSAFENGLQCMASLLLSLQDPALVEDYGWWLIQQDETTGLKIFMPGDAKRAAMFDVDRVLARCKSSISRAGLLSYLEYVVIQRRSETPDHHKMLCLLYIENISRYMEDPNNVAHHQEIVTEFTKMQEAHLLQPGATSAANSLAVGSSGTFMAFLQSHAKADAMFGCRLSKHKECIEVMVKGVKDYQGAELFCLNGGVMKISKRSSKAVVNDGSHPKESASESSMRKKLFMILLQEYLLMSQDQGGMVLTLHLLNSQSSYLDISEVINLLPTFWSVELLQQYLLRSLRRSYHDFKEIQVVKGLSLGENLRISEELFQLYERSGPVVITADIVCDVCGIAVADAVFMKTVDSKIIHLHCGSPSVA